MPPKVGSDSGTSSCRVPALKKSPSVPRTIPARNNATVLAAAERLKPKNHTQAAATNQSDDPRCETSSTVRVGHGSESAFRKSKKVPPMSVVAQRGQMPAARRAAVVEFRSPRGMPPDDAFFFALPGSGDESVMINSTLETAREKSLL